MADTTAPPVTEWTDEVMPWTNESPVDQRVEGFPLLTRRQPLIAVE